MSRGWGGDEKKNCGVGRGLEEIVWMRGVCEAY